MVTGYPWSLFRKLLFTTTDPGDQVSTRQQWPADRVTGVRTMKRFVHGPILSYSPYLALALFLMLVLTSLNYFYLSSQNYQLLSSNTNQQKDIDHLQVLNPVLSSVSLNGKGGQFLDLLKVFLVQKGKENIINFNNIICTN